MKANLRVPEKRFRKLASSFSLSEKLTAGAGRTTCRPASYSHDERNSAGILTWGLTSLPPSQPYFHFEYFEYFDLDLRWQTLACTTHTASGVGSL